MVEVTQAMQFTGNNCIEILRFIGNPEWGNPMLHNSDLPCVGDKVAEPGDWIIKTGEAVIITSPREATFNAGQKAMREAAAKVAEKTILDARTGEIDNDLRSIGYILGSDIRNLKIGEE